MAGGHSTGNMTPFSRTMRQHRCDTAEVTIAETCLGSRLRGNDAENVAVLVHSQPKQE